MRARGSPQWFGERLDVRWAIDVLHPRGEALPPTGPRA